MIILLYVVIYFILGAIAGGCVFALIDKHAKPETAGQVSMHMQVTLISSVIWPVIPFVFIGWCAYLICSRGTVNK